MFRAASKTWSQPRSAFYNQSDELPFCFLPLMKACRTRPGEYVHSPYTYNPSHTSIPPDCYLVSRTVVAPYPSPPEQGGRSAPANYRTPRCFRHKICSNCSCGTAAGKRLPSARGRAGGTHRQNSRCPHVGTVPLSCGSFHSVATCRPCTIGGQGCRFAPPRGRPGPVRPVQRANVDLDISGARPPYVFRESSQRIR